jgi:alkylation response protein AidB-like acyl-CoA dehydrogenase
MVSLLTSEQQARYREFQQFVKTSVEPDAHRWDSQGEIPLAIISELARRGYLGSTIPSEYGGQGWDYVTFGLLNEALGRGCSSLAGLITVQTMVVMTLLKWGTDKQRSRWIKPLANGETIASFALTEPNVGSAIQSIETAFTQDGDSYMLNGCKRWISGGQIADLFLVFGRMENKSIACLVPKDTPGLVITPIDTMLGFRAARLAQIDFSGVRVSAEDLVGKPGFALSHVAPIGLQYGRLSTACSALGLLRACFEESVAYASTRQISGRRIGEEGMIRSLITQIGADLQAANLLCYSACKAEDGHLPETFEKTMVAKYFTSRAAVRAASNAVQIRGASGCHESSPVARLYRDAKIMEIIEGTTQIHEQVLGRIFIQKAPKAHK